MLCASIFSRLEYFEVILFLNKVLLFDKRKTQKDSDLWCTEAECCFSPCLVLTQSAVSQNHRRKKKKKS